jgi:CubicO group peptidase (beta-lactamase class C family)
MRGKDWIKKGALAGPVQRKPGEQWNYCTLGFNVLAEVVGRASGMHYNDYVREHTFKRIGMDRSFMEVPKELWPQVMRHSPWIEQALLRSGDRSGCPNGGTLEGARLLGRKTVEEMTRNQLEGVGSYHWGKNCKSYRQGLGWEFYCDGPTVGPVERCVFVSMVNDDSAWSPDVMVKPRTIAFAGID